jgi:hypothetical protein
LLLTTKLLYVEHHRLFGLFAALLKKGEAEPFKKITVVW